jgi:hypothetical protein
MSMLTRIVLAFALLLASLAQAGAQTLASAADLARDFEQIAFPQWDLPPGLQRPKPQFRRAPQSLPKPLKISIFENPDNPAAARELEDILSGLAGTLRQETRVRIQARPGAHHPFVVTGVRERHFKTMAHFLGVGDPSFLGAFAFAQGITKQGCFFYSMSDDDGRIVGGKVIVDLDRPEIWRRCVYRGVVFMLGLEGDTLAPTGIFTEVPQVRGLTARDLAIVRMAFDPRLKPGMTLAEARPLLPAIAADALAR